MARTIESPGVQITEIDISRNPQLTTGTKVFLAGFAPQGPADEIIQVSSLGEFTSIYGVPTTPAERYFYHSAAPLFNTQAQVFTYRLPYGSGSGNGFGNYYSALVYTCTAVNFDQNLLLSTTLSSTYGTFPTTYSASQSGVLYLLGRPVHFDLTQDQYNSILQQNNGFTWSNTPTTLQALTSQSGSPFSLSALGGAGFIVLNKGQTTINDNYEGYYIGIADNTHVNPAYDFTAVNDAQTITQTFISGGTSRYTQLPTTRLNFSLSSISDNHPISFGLYGDHGTSISQVLADSPTFNIDSPTFNDTLVVGLFKLNQSVFSPTTIKLDFSYSERYVGSFDYWREINSQAGGKPSSFFLETREDSSPNITMLINPFISHQNGQTWLNRFGTPTNAVRMITSEYSSSNVVTLLSSLSTGYGITNNATAYTAVRLLSAALNSAFNNLNRADSIFPVGSYQSSNNQTKDLGSINQKLDRMFNMAENTELYDFDISLDAGISTIFTVSQWIDSVPSLSSTNKYFDDTLFVTAITGLYVTNPEDVIGSALTFSSNYQAITNKYVSFAGLKRMDHLYIADLPRNIFVQGSNTPILESDLNNFSLNVYTPIKNVTGSINTSYATTYGNWVKVFDNTLNDFVWVPFSGFAGASMAVTDALYQPWYAPAGFTRGNVVGVTQLAITPNQKQRDQLYKIPVNPVTFFPNEGYVIYGQKTFLKQPSAFDRINVRRLFLNLEKSTANTVKFFVFEPNTLLTRTRIINTLTPIFENAKNTEGLYDYLIVCDERNNTPDIIDQNELVVDIYLKPVRTAEFILVNFYATRTGTNFQELVS